jgi:hypothetical protein
LAWSETRQETMRVLTINELTRLTRIELCGLYRQIISILSELPEGSPEHHNTLLNLRNIRWALARRDLSPD